DRARDRLPRRPVAAHHRPTVEGVAVIRAVLRTWSGRIGAALVSIMIVAALVSLVWTPHDPTRVNPRQKWLPMSSDHWLGTDGSGKDIFSVVLAGARSTLFVVLASVLLAALIGLA